VVEHARWRLTRGTCLRDHVDRVGGNGHLVRACEQSVERIRRRIGSPQLAGDARSCGGLKLQRDRRVCCRRGAT
jgi:hypothetical protein